MNKLFSNQRTHCRKFGFLILLLTGGLLFQPSVAAELQLTVAEQKWLADHRDERITIAFDADFAPYSFRDAEQGAFQGIAIDFALELSRQVGLKLSFYPDGLWKNLYAAAQEREVDVIATLTERPGREEWFSYTRPYLYITQFVVTRKDYDDIRHRDHLAGKRVALVEAYSSTNDALKAYPDIIPYYVQNLTDAIKAVSSGQAEAMFTGLGIAQHLIEKHDIDNLKFAALYTKGAGNQRFGVRNDWPELASIMDKALAAMPEQQKLGLFLRWTKPLVAEQEIKGN